VHTPAPSLASALPPLPRDGRSSALPRGHEGAVPSPPDVGSAAALMRAGVRMLSNPCDLFFSNAFHGGAARVLYKYTSLGEVAVLVHLVASYGTLAPSPPPPPPHFLSFYSRPPSLSSFTHRGIPHAIATATSGLQRVQRGAGLMRARRAGWVLFAGALPVAWYVAKDLVQ